MSKKTNKLTNHIKRSAIARHLSDLVLSSVIALFLFGLINEYIGLEKLSASLKYKTSANLMSAFTESNLGDISAQYMEVHSTFLQLGLFLVLALGILAFYALIHLRLSSSEKIKTKLKTSEFQQYFTSIITGDNKSDNYLNEPSSQSRVHLSKIDIYNVNNRAILLKELRSMHSLVGDTGKSRLEDQYFALGFVDELEDKFQSPDWVERAQAINEATQFKVASHYSFINKLLLDKNETVRQNAVIAKMKLDDQPLEILKSINRPLSIWEKHQMFLAIKAVPYHKLPAFNELLLNHTIHKSFIKDLQTQLDG